MKKRKKIELVPILMWVCILLMSIADLTQNLWIRDLQARIEKLEAQE